VSRKKKQNGLGGGGAAVDDKGDKANSSKKIPGSGRITGNLQKGQGGGNGKWRGGIISKKIQKTGKKGRNEEYSKKIGHP